MWLVLVLMVWACRVGAGVAGVGVGASADGGVGVWGCGVMPLVVSGRGGAGCVVRLGGCGSFWSMGHGFDGGGIFRCVEGAGLLDVAFSLVGRAVLEDRGVVLGR